MNDPIIAILGAIIGFLGKSSWDIYWKRRHEKETLTQAKRMDLLERQLNEFYWPLLFLLRKNNIVWQRILQAHDPGDELEKDLSFKLSRQYFFPNNEKILEIIEGKYYLAQPPKEVSRQIELFICHQAIFQGIRNTLDNDVDPYRFGEPWPSGFLPAIEAHTLKLQSEYDSFLGIENSG